MGTIDIKSLRLTVDQGEVFREAMRAIDKHNQAAIHLYTGGGKSYILAKILSELKNRAESARRTQFRVLYLSKPGSCKRVSSLLDNEYWNEFMSYISFTQLQHNERAIDSEGLYGKNCIDVIVIDEAHGALAPETYKGIEYTIKRNNKATIIAMSANDQRYDSRRYIFDWLTPKLTLGIDYKDRGFQWAVANNKLSEFTYKGGNLARLQSYCDLINELKDNALIYGDCDELVAKARNIIADYSENMFSKLGTTIKTDLSNIKYDGKQGERWFVFFNYVDEIVENIDKVQDMFNEAYSNYNVTVNVYEYHNKKTTTHNKFVEEKVLTSKAESGNIDVILTCQKGGESFHPDSTRGIVMYRRSKSIINVTQMVGRPLEVKELGTEHKLIYDPVGNSETLENSRSREEQGENTASLLERIKQTRATDEMLESLDKAYEGAISLESMDYNIDNMLDDLDEIAFRAEKILDANIISEIIGDEKDRSKIIKLIKDHDKNSKNNYNAEEKLIELQKLFIQGYFGEYTADQLKKTTEQNETEQNETEINSELDTQRAEFIAIYDKLGDLLYDTLKADRETKVTLKELQEIADEVKKYNYDYSRIRHTKDLKNKISDLRTLNLNGEICESHQVFCKRNKIDIDGTYVNLVETVLKSDEAYRHPEIIKEFKYICKRLNIIYDKIKTTGLNNGDRIELKMLLAKEHVFTAQHINTTFGKQASNAIRIKYKSLLRLAKSSVQNSDYRNADEDIKGILRIRAFSNDLNDTRKYRKLFGDTYEKYILRLAKRNENSLIGEYEGYVLDELNIKTIKDKRDAAIRSMLDKTPFGITYKEFVETNSSIAHNKLMSYKEEDLPSYCNDLLRKRVFKKSINIAEKNSLYQKDSKYIKNIVSQLYYADSEQIKTIKQAVKNKEIDARKLIVYALPTKAYNSYKSYIDDAVTTPWHALPLEKQTKVEEALGDQMVYCEDIIQNLLDANLIPDEQTELAQHLISFN